MWYTQSVCKNLQKGVRSRLPRAHGITLDDKNRDLLFREDGKQIPWSLDKRGWVIYNIWENGKLRRVLLHRLVAARMIAPEPLTRRIRVLFKNGNRQDCRESNLELTDYSQQHQARPKRAGKSSKYKGVTWWKARGRWRTKLVYSEDGHSIEKSLGVHVIEEDAGWAYDEEARKRFPHPYLNFPGGYNQYQAARAAALGVQQS